MTYALNHQALVNIHHGLLHPIIVNSNLGYSLLSREQGKQFVRGIDGHGFLFLETRVVRPKRAVQVNCQGQVGGILRMGCESKRLW